MGANASISRLARRAITVAGAVAVAILLSQAFGQAAPPEQSVEEIARQTRPSLVAITHASRPGAGDREGSGFFVAPGLLATNLHVIGEARPIKVSTSEGDDLEVVAVHASDRKLDLALLEVKERDHPVLPLGDSDALPDGLSVIAMGNPQGLRYSVVEGVISATRPIDGLDMIQLAIPIEPGNSGGPLLDRQGRVIGIPTLKSQLSDNIGFAMPVNGLKLLLEKPNPIPIDRWVTVGRLSPSKWKPLQAGANWRQRAGTITVTGQGAGFGGRALCLYRSLPEASYEVSVKVKLDDETGAAGLAFASDAGDRHYGFYPSGGNIRLTHFSGPDVFSWNILADQPVASYQPGEWNHLRAVVTPETITGYVNGEKVVEVAHKALRDGQVGLCKFRDTEASFQGFSLGQPSEPAEARPELAEQLMEVIETQLNQAHSSPALSAGVSDLEAHPGAAIALMEKRARLLESQAAQLRDWAIDLHHHQVCQAMRQVVKEREDQDIDLFHAGLLIAKLSQPDLDTVAYQQEIEAMAEEIRTQVGPDADSEKILEQLSNYLFQQLGFHGSRLDYYNRENSYLNTVLEDREGIPITLSLLYLELAHRLGVTELVGIPLPGHFVVQYQPEEGPNQLIDVFDAGKVITREEAETIVAQATGLPLRDEHLAPASKKSMLVRMLRNLIGIDLESEDPTQALPELDLLLTIAPEEASERLSRALLLYQANRSAEALADLAWILERKPEGIHLDRVAQLKDRLDAILGR